MKHYFRYISVSMAICVLCCIVALNLDHIGKWPIKSLVPIGVENGGERHDWWSDETIYNIIGATLLVLDVQMKLLQICGPLLMAIILQLPLCLYELQGRWSVWMIVSFPKM